MKKFFNGTLYFKILFILFCSISYSIFKKEFEIVNILLLFTFLFVIFYFVKVIKNDKRCEEYFFGNKELRPLVMDISYDTCLKSLEEACASKVNGDELVKKFKDKYDSNNNAFYIWSCFIFNLSAIITAISILTSFNVLPFSSSIFGTFFTVICLPISSVIMLSFQESVAVERFTTYWEIKNSLSNIPTIIIPNSSCMRKTSNKPSVAVKVRLIKKVEAS